MNELKTVQTMSETGPAESAIYCQSLSKHYAEITALDDLTLAVPYGSVFGFLGRNGAGKTTTMRLLAGLARPTAGRAWIAGVEATGDTPLARGRFGYLPQAPAFYNWMTARDYLDYIAQILGLSAVERKRQISELLELSDLKEAARRKIGGFSGGMLQRLGIAQALIGQPPVLLLDEPTSALDPAGRYEVLDMIANLRGKTTVFLSSHILTDIERVCDTLAVLHKGRLLLVSDREALIAQHAVNAVELELDGANGQPETPSEAVEVFIQAVQACAWAAGVKREGKLLRVMVQDAALARHELLVLAAAHNLLLRRYEWVQPTLEEIFLQLSN
jgi:ABC-2 type transport system ATP-binding protein